MTYGAAPVPSYSIDDEISDLERQLQDAKARKALGRQVTPERLVTRDGTVNSLSLGG